MVLCEYACFLHLASGNIHILCVKISYHCAVMYTMTLFLPVVDKILNCMMTKNIYEQLNLDAVTGRHACYRIKNITVFYCPFKMLTQRRQTF